MAAQQTTTKTFAELDNIVPDCRENITHIVDKNNKEKPYCIKIPSNKNNNNNIVDINDQTHIKSMLKDDIITGNEYNKAYPSYNM